MATAMKSICDVKTEHPGGFADIIQALRDTAEPKHAKLADALEALNGSSTGLLARAAYALLKKAGLPTSDDGKAWKMYAENWFK